MIMKCVVLQEISSSSFFIKKMGYYKHAMQRYPMKNDYEHQRVLRMTSYLLKRVKNKIKSFSLAFQN